MITTILSQSDIKAQSSSVKLHEYSVTFINWEEQKVEQFTAAFPFFPSTKDWETLAYNWNSIGYELACNPLLVHTI